MENTFTPGIVQADYGQMVQKLLKKDLSGQDEARSQVMHAGIGIAGEALEIKAAKSRDELIKEFGDLEFYIQAMFQSLPGLMNVGTYVRGEELDYRCPFAQTMTNIENLGNLILDLSKKIWVYNAGIDKVIACVEVTGSLRNQLEHAYHYFGISREDVLNHNKEKLIGAKGRYCEGFYSDEAANNCRDGASEVSA